MDQKQFDEVCKQLRDRKDDLRPTDVNVFPEPLLSTLHYALRVGRISFSELMKRLDVKPEQARALADLLVKRNLFQISAFSQTDDVFYETRLSTSTRPLMRPKLGVWKNTDEGK
ncbi:MAG: hypothetical protein HY869_22710 [Chloroflexi bacterium]|nr:hypothetical protein [Chloroflexota bacterium]